MQIKGCPTDSVERKTEDVLMRTRKMDVREHGKIGRPKLWWSDVIRKHMKEKEYR